MAKGSGGTRGASGGGASLQNALRGAESSIRNRSVENAYVFDKTGNEVYRNIEGETIQLSDNPKINAMLNKLRRGLNGVEIPKQYWANNVVTHNHPLNDSFSYGDVGNAIALNAREIRAVTPSRIYSLKRPKSGWKVSASEVMSEHRKINQSSKSQHETMMKLAAKFNLDYSWTQ